MSKWLNYVLVAIGLVVVVVMARHKVHVLWVIATATGLMFLSYLSEQLESHLWRRKRGRELPSPFLAEVLFDGNVVATLSERRVTEMFWRSYQITPLTPEHKAIILNDATWERGEFTFAIQLQITYARLVSSAVHAPSSVRDESTLELSISRRRANLRIDT